jgi:hypothetical protein
MPIRGLIIAVEVLEANEQERGNESRSDPGLSLGEHLAKMDNCLTVLLQSELMAFNANYHRHNHAKRIKGAIVKCSCDSIESHNGVSD